MVSLLDSLSASLRAEPNRLQLAEQKRGFDSQSQHHRTSPGGSVVRNPSANVGDAGAAAKSLQSYPTLCDPIDGSPPGYPVSGILQARTLEWVAISFSNAWK